MADKPPAFLWYPKDCDTDEHVRLMSDRELGFYIRCLNHSWINGSLPADPSEIARLMRVPGSYVAKVWPRVSPCWTPHPEQPERLVNRKQEDYRASLTVKSFKSSEAAHARWMRRQCGRNADAHADASTPQCDGNALHLHTASAIAKSTTTTPLQRAHLTTSEWPETTDAICGEFTATDDALLFQIINAAAQTWMDGTPGRDLTDKYLAEAVREARKQSPTQYNAALYITTVPKIIRNWIRQAKGGRRG